MRPLIANSITHVPTGAGGKPLVCASHGGVFAAQCALKAGVSSAIFNDAGIGRDRAGVAGLVVLDECGVAAATVSHRSARIGDGADTFQRGVVSTVNESARAVGAVVGMSAREVWRLFAKHAAGKRDASGLSGSVVESRRVEVAKHGMPLVIIDSNSLVSGADSEAVVITGSHGGLLGGDPRSAISEQVFAAFYNDADVGVDEAGIGRLRPLNDRGVAAVTVGAWTARIGDARSTLEDGVITHANDLATRCGAQRGQSARRFLDALAEEWVRRARGTSLRV